MFTVRFLLLRNIVYCDMTECVIPSPVIVCTYLLNPGLLFSVAIGILLGICVGGCLLALVLSCRRRSVSSSFSFLHFVIIIVIIRRDSSSSVISSALVMGYLQMDSLLQCLALDDDIRCLVCLWRMSTVKVQDVSLPST